LQLIEARGTCLHIVFTHLHGLHGGLLKRNG
jgi:hypothetical protein